MARNITLGLAILGLILAGAVLIVPVAAANAAPGGQGGPGAHNRDRLMNTSNLDPALKDDLWALHSNERLAQFDLNVKKGQDTIAVLNNHNYDTSDLTGILSQIISNRSALENAITGKDKTALKTVNKDLLDLWKQFGKTMKKVLNI
jgi:Spy/CpxP family protein refolding chaperone